MRLVAYLRVSTDDKGQDPDRQKLPIQARADRDGHTISAWVVDEGTSGGVPALDRPKVKEAVRLAKEHGAGALIVEAVDRWSRGGWQDVGVSMFRLQTDHELGLVFADLHGDDFVVELLTGILATIAKMTRQRLREMTKSGIDNARRKGIRIGRPPKHPPTPDEWATIDQMKADGKGWRLIALAISNGRGAHEVADAKAKRYRTVSARWLEAQAKDRAGKTPGSAAGHSRKRSGTRGESIGVSPRSRPDEGGRDAVEGAVVLEPAQQRQHGAHVPHDPAGPA